MDDDPTYAYIKLAADWLPAWFIALAVIALWLITHPDLILRIREHISSAKLGTFEIQLRELKTELEEAKREVAEVREANLQLSEIVSEIDADAPAEQLAGARRALKAIAGNVDDLDAVYADLEAGTPPERFYAAAEILRARKSVAGFDRLIASARRIAASEDLEGYRLKFIWSLASAVHRTVLSAVKYSDPPALSVDQLSQAREAMQSLHDHPKVAADRPDDPAKGIRGPVRYALDWIGKGLDKHTNPTGG